MLCVDRFKNRRFVASGSWANADVCKLLYERNDE